MNSLVKCGRGATGQMVCEWMDDIFVTLVY